MTQTHIIALTGLAGAGKDSVADVLVNHAGFTKLAFAGALRQEIIEAFRLDTDGSDALLSNRDTKEVPTQRLSMMECRDYGFIGAVAEATRATVRVEWCSAPRSPRQVMQWWGTEYRRDRTSVDYWTRQLADHIRRLHRIDGRSKFVITDCRFENEAALLRQMGGVVWQVVRGNIAPVEGGHASQADGSKLQPSAIIDNHSTLDALRDQVLGEWWAMEAQLESVKVEAQA